MDDEQVDIELRTWEPTSTCTSNTFPLMHYGDRFARHCSRNALMLSEAGYEKAVVQQFPRDGTRCP